MAHEPTVCNTLRLAQRREKALANKGRRVNPLSEFRNGATVPRKSKTATDQAASSDAENPPQPSAVPLPAVPKVATRAKTSGAKKKTARNTTPKRAKAQAAPGSSPADSARRWTDDDIRLRAYFIAERRMQLSIPGSEAEDWLEAKRQLEAESGDGSA
jgi:outer membrane biosynthesis protein TonB